MKYYNIMTVFELYGVHAVMCLQIVICKGGRSVCLRQAYCYRIQVPVNLAMSSDGIGYGMMVDCCVNGKSLAMYLCT